MANARVLEIDLDRDGISDEEILIGSDDGFSIMRVESPVDMKINNVNAEPFPAIPGKWCGSVNRIFLTADRASDSKLYIAVPNNGIHFTPATDGGLVTGSPRLFVPADPGIESGYGGDEYLAARAGYQQLVVSADDVTGAQQSETLRNVNSLSILMAVVVRNLIGTPQFTPEIYWGEKQDVDSYQTGKGLLTSQEAIWTATTPIAADGEYLYNFVSTGTGNFEESVPIPLPPYFRVGVSTAGGAAGTDEADIDILLAWIP